MYSETAWEHMTHPRNRQPLESSFTGEAYYPKCGDKLRLYVQVQNDIIAQCAFEAKACGPVLAAASVGTGLVRGLSPPQARALSAFELDSSLRLPPPKRHALLMFLDCLHQALDAWETQHFEGSNPNACDS